MRPAKVHWGHSLGFLYWVLAGEGDGSLSTQELGEVSRALGRWLGDRYEAEGVAAVAQESLDWYLGIRGEREALEREIEWILAALRDEDWFTGPFKDQVRKDLAKIALADGRVSGDEARLVGRILEALDVSAPDVPWKR